MPKLKKWVIKQIKNVFALGVISLVIFTTIRLKFGPQSSVNIVTEKYEIREETDCTTVQHGDISYTHCNKINEDFKTEDSEYKAVQNIIVSALNVYPHSTLVDIGAGTGRLTSLAAKMGHQVVAVEREPSNIAFIQFALIDLNDVKNRVTLLLNSVSDSSKDQSYIPKNSHHAEVSSTSLEEILELVNTKEIILNIDTPGFECKAITRYLWQKPKVKFVPYIRMGWGQVYTPQGGMSEDCEEFPQMTEGFRVSGYSAYTTKIIQMQELMSTQLDSVLWVHKDALPLVLP